MYVDDHILPHCALNRVFSSTLARMIVQFVVFHSFPDLQKKFTQVKMVSLFVAWTYHQREMKCGYRMALVVLPTWIFAKINSTSADMNCPKRK